MNSKAIRKQLLAAVAMVLVAAVALGSSTYAWFAQNNKVTASTAQISASAQNALSIKDADEDWKTSITLTNGSAKEVSPIHYYYTGSAIEWYSISADNAVLNPDDEAATVPFATYIADTAAEGNVGMFKKETETAYNVSSVSPAVDYVIGNEFQLKATGTLAAAGEKVTSTIKVQLPDDVTTTNMAANIYKAFHVVYVVTPTGGTASRIETDFSDGSLAVNPETGKVELTANVATDIVATVEADKVYNVVAYLFLEGEDSDCYTSNATSVQNLRVSFEFEKAIKS